MLSGELDSEQSAAVSLLLGSQIRAPRKISMPGAAHFPTLEKPTRFNQIVFAFLEIEACPRWSLLLTRFGLQQPRFRIVRSPPVAAGTKRMGEGWIMVILVEAALASQAWPRSRR